MPFSRFAGDCFTEKRANNPVVIVTHVSTIIPLWNSGVCVFDIQCWDFRQIIFSFSPPFDPNLQATNRSVSETPLCLNLVTPDSCGSNYVLDEVSLHLRMIHTLSLSLKRHVRAKKSLTEAHLFNLHQGPETLRKCKSLPVLAEDHMHVSTSSNIQCAYTTIIIIIIIIIVVSSSRVPVEKISVATPMKASETMLSMATEMLSCRATFLYKLGCILSSSSPR